MQIPQEWFWPYVASNLTALAILLIAWKRPIVAKWLFAIMFFGACVANTSLVLQDPDQYLNYDKYVLFGLYHSFINGFFAEHLQPIVLSIAGGQLLVGLLLCGSGVIGRLGCLGAGVFLAAIIPLGVGSAFPFSLICIAALLLIEAHLRHAARRFGNSKGSSQSLAH